MHFLKNIIGTFWSSLLNKRLVATRDFAAVTVIVEKCDRHPVLFQDVSRSVCIQTLFGFAIKCDRTDYIGRSIIFTGVWEPLIAQTIRHCLKDGDLCIDIGANIGFDTLVMATAVGHDGHVIAIEPDWTNIMSLIANLKLNRIANVELLSIGVGSEHGSAILNVGGQRGHSNFRPGQDVEIDHQSVAIAPIKAVLASSRDRIRLIKLDIEGFEYNALKGLGDLLQRTDVVLCEIDDNFLSECGSSSRELFDLMRSFGFTSYCADPESNGPWKLGDESYVSAKTFTSGHRPFDAFFVRPEAVDIQPLLTQARI